MKACQWMAKTLGAKKLCKCYKNHRRKRWRRFSRRCRAFAQELLASKCLELAGAFGLGATGALFALGAGPRWGRAMRGMMVAPFGVVAPYAAHHRRGNGSLRVLASPLAAAFPVHAQLR